MWWVVALEGIMSKFRIFITKCARESRKCHKKLKHARETNTLKPISVYTIPIGHQPIMRTTTLASINRNNHGTSQRWKHVFRHNIHGKQYILEWTMPTWSADHKEYNSYENSWGPFIPINKPCVFEPTEGIRFPIRKAQQQGTFMIDTSSMEYTGTHGVMHSKEIEQSFQESANVEEDRDRKPWTSNPMWWYK